MQIKENIKALRYWPLWGEFPAQRASNAENVIMCMQYHVILGHIITALDCMLLVYPYILHDYFEHWHWNTGVVVGLAHRQKQVTPGRVLTLWRLLHMLHHFDPLFQVSGKFARFWPLYLSKNEENVKFRALFFCRNFAKCIVLTPFLPFVAFWVNRRCWASLSKIQVRPSPPTLLWASKPGNMSKCMTKLHQ